MKVATIFGSMMIAVIVSVALSKDKSDSKLEATATNEIFIIRRSPSLILETYWGEDHDVGMRWKTTNENIEIEGHNCGLPFNYTNLLCAQATNIFISSNYLGTIEFSGRFFRVRDLK